MDNIIQFGIWTLNNDGVKGSPKNFPEVQINNSELWGTTKRKDQIVWDLPVHFAEEVWCDEEQAVNLIQMLAIARENQNTEDPGEFPVDIDEQTIRVMMEIIDDKIEPGETE